MKAKDVTPGMTVRGAKVDSVLRKRAVETWLYANGTRKESQSSYVVLYLTDFRVLSFAQDDEVEAHA